MALAVVCWKLLVRNLHRTFRMVELALSMQQTLDFTAVDSFRVEEHLSIAVWLGKHWGVLLANKVVMVIMTSICVPTGGAHSLGTEEIILFSG